MNCIYSISILSNKTIIKKHYFIVTFIKVAILNSKIWLIDIYEI
jgi:hypothetical protein